MKAKQSKNQELHPLTPHQKQRLSYLLEYKRQILALRMMIDRELASIDDPDDQSISDALASVAFEVYKINRQINTIDKVRHWE